MRSGILYTIIKVNVPKLKVMQAHPNSGEHERQGKRFHVEAMCVGNAHLEENRSVEERHGFGEMRVGTVYLLPRDER